MRRDLTSGPVGREAEVIALNDFDGSAARLAEIRQAEADLKAKAQRDRVSLPVVAKLSKRGRAEGRPKKAGSMRDVEAATGISQPEQKRVERHVELAERFPFPKRPGNGSTMGTVLLAGEALERVPASRFPPPVGHR